MDGFAAIDIGNSLVKLWRYCPSTGWEVTACGVEEAAAVCRADGIARVAFCSTRSLSPAELSLAGEAGWWEFGCGMSLPLEVRYAAPEKLGPDRLAAAVGASALFPGESLLVADSGTALTLDVVAGSGVFVGGNISPGLELRLRSLHEHTSKLPLVSVDGDAEAFFGRDTRSAIAAGCRMGLAYETAGAFRVAEREFGCHRVVATGGDASRLASDLRKAFGEDWPVCVVPELVAMGLKTAYDLNHDK